MKLRIFLVTCLSVLTSISANPQMSYVRDSTQLQDVEEAAFRYFFSHELAGSKAEAFCISSAKPLLPDFIQRFAGNNPPVMFLYACPFHGSTKELPTSTKERPEHVGILDIHWMNASDAEVRGQCRNGELGFTQLMLHLVRKNGHWSVIDVKVEVYS